ncbi:MAG TPA: T9SS type A sorting domain-containing protein [Bacteroidia bacterium]|nr:T9SS type A sorting domain-containing protein [Bacteroidia bacterium]
MKKKLFLLLIIFFCLYQIPLKVRGLNSISFPVELVTFYAITDGDDVKLSWSTSSEKSVSYFTIEKTKDFLTFETVIVMNGSGNSNSLIEYETIDKNPFSGKSYYRLKLTDFSGDFIYSAFVAVETLNTMVFSMDVYPNPSSGDNLNLLLNADANQEVLVVVYDITGKESYSKVLITSTNGENVYAIDPSSKLIPGVYFITATSQQNIYSKRLIVN